MLNVQEIKFYGNTITCIETGGEVYGSIKDVCKGMGLDYVTQLSAIRSTNWTVKTFTLPSGDKMNMLSLMEVQEWMDILAEAVRSEQLIVHYVDEFKTKDVEFDD